MVKKFRSIKRSELGKYFRKFANMTTSYFI